MTTQEVARDGKRYVVEFDADARPVAVRVHSRSALFDPHMRDIWRVSSGKAPSARTREIILTAQWGE